MSTRFPILPLLTTVIFTCGMAAVFYQRRAETLIRLQQPAAAAARPSKVPASVIGASRPPAVRLQAIRQQFSKMSGTGIEQLRAFESLSRDELVALLLAEGPPWEGAQILPWKLRLFARYAELDSAAALFLADSAFPVPYDWLAATRPLLLRWAAQEPEAAATYWRVLPVSRERLSGSSEWREIDAAMEEAVPDSAAWAKFTTALEAVPDQLPTDRQARHVARDASDAARMLAGNFRSGPSRGRALTAMLGKGRGSIELYGVEALAAYWAEDEPVQARAWLKGIVGRLPEAATLAPAMALKNLDNYEGIPADAVDFALWAHALHPAGCTPDWWAESVGSNASSRPAGAAALLQAVPAETDHDPAILAWLENTEAPSAVTAAALVAQINDPAKRATAESMLRTKAGSPAEGTQP